MRTSARSGFLRRVAGSRTSGYLAVLAAAVVAVTLMETVPALAEPEPEWELPAPPEAVDVPVSQVEHTPRPVWSAGDAVVAGEAEVAWPEPATVRAQLPAASAAQAGPATATGAPQPGRPGRITAGELPVRVGAAPVSAGGPDDVTDGMRLAPAAVRLRMAGRAETAAAGVTGLLLGVARDDGRPQPAEVTVEIDYSGLRHAYGGDWTSRLRVSVLGVDGAPTALPAANDHQAGVVAATVPLPAGGGFTMLSVSGGESGDNGDYTATDLSPAATWDVSQQTGDFAWSYPLRVVPGVGGPEPDLAMEYSSSSIDGRTAATNTQGSWLGDGWDMWPGFIERGYRVCADDTDPESGQQPNNRNQETADLCWFSDNATMSLNGAAVELVPAGGGRYRPVDDDGTRIEKLTDSSLGNGARGGEYWKVTTTDGTQYFFGRHRRQGFPADNAATNSVWTAPVYGNHPGEPCYQAGNFSGSRCTQAWRWNLDYVVDPHGNSMTMFYTKETGAYGREFKPDLRTTYHRGGTLARIEYGTRAGQEHQSPAPMRVLFEVADRCKPGASCTTSNTSAWPDTPWDLYCASAPCTDQLAPTFWSQKRLERVRAQVRDGSSYTTVESWALRHEWLDAGSWAGESIPMWLRGITRTGHVGSAISDPEIVFDAGGAPLDNRVDGPTDDRSSLARWRIRTITTESGAQLGISYSGRDCTRSSLPTPHTNTKRCFPQWYGPYQEEPTLDWFHKYVVTRVDVHDNTGASGHQQTNYQYLDAPAWHYDDSQLVLPKHRTWGQWRGYSRVRVSEGLPTGPGSRTDYLYLRGMHGDRASPSGGTRTVSVTDSQGESITDHRAHAGFLREETVYNGVNGGWVGGSIHTPWRHETASSGPLRAYLTGTARTRTRTALAGGDVRWTRVDTAFDTTYGLPTQVDDRGDESVGDDEQCTRYTYARNPSAWMVELVSRTETVGVRCAATPSRPGDVLADERIYFDNADTHGAAPTRGLPVRTEEVGSWNGSAPVWVTTSRTSYDAHGRQVARSDALDRRTTTAYTPATGGPLTQAVETDPLGHIETTLLQPAWGLPARITDPNGHVTDLSYDAFGRLVAVWLPGRRKGSDGPNLEYAYQVRNRAPTTVTTRTLLPTRSGDAYRTSITLLDGLLRERQVQTQAPGGGRVIADTVYDSRGLVDWESNGYYNSGAPSTTLVATAGEPQIPGITEYVYDGAGRVTDAIFRANGNEAWRTRYGYGGDRIHVTPPAGGTATTTIEDAHARVVALRQYLGRTPSGAFDETRYAYTKRDELATVTDAAGNLWSFTYDQRGREITAVDPATGTTSTGYDAASQVITVTDARGITLGYTYDALGRLRSVRDGSPTGAKRAEWVYDTLPSGIGELTRSIRYQDGEQYVDEVLGYDQAGRPTGNRVSIPSSETGLAGSYETRLHYYPDGSVGAIELPALGGLPSEWIEYDYDDVGAPTAMVSHTRYVDNVTYSKLGNLEQRVLGSGGRQVTLTYTFDDPTGRLLQAAAAAEMQPQILNLHYSYDAAGNLTRIADLGEGSGVADTQCYRYDHLRRLIDAWTPAATAAANCQPSPSAAALGGAAPYWRSWTYDVTGNRLTQTAHSTLGDTVTSYQHPEHGGPQPHTVTSAETTSTGATTRKTYAYDPAGNMTLRAVGGNEQALAWDAEGKLATVTSGSELTSYLYDADGDRLIRRDAGGATLYLPDGQELRYHANTGAATGTRYYEHAGDTVAVRTEDGLSWLVNDHHGTAEVAVDATDLSVQHRRALPFGQTRGPDPSAWPGDKGFVGGTEDPTGLTNLGAREYDPDLGRFVSVDPLVAYFEPQTMHGYAYANNAPPTFVDADGLQWIELPDDLFPPDPSDLCACGNFAPDDVRPEESKGVHPTVALIAIGVVAWNFYQRTWGGRTPAAPHTSPAPPDPQPDPAPRTGPESGPDVPSPSSDGGGGWVSKIVVWYSTSLLAGAVATTVSGMLLGGAVSLSGLVSSVVVGAASAAVARWAASQLAQSIAATLVGVGAGIAQVVHDRRAKSKPKSPKSRGTSCRYTTRGCGSKSTPSGKKKTYSGPTCQYTPRGCGSSGGGGSKKSSGKSPKNNWRSKACGGCYEI